MHQLVLSVSITMLDLVDMALKSFSCFVLVKVYFERGQAIYRNIWLSSETDWAYFLSHFFLSDFGILCFD